MLKMKELSLHILDIVQNSIRAEANWIKVIVDEDPESNWLTISIEDNGKGIPEGIKATVTNPFTTTRTLRKVGLGLPLFSQLCVECEGELKVTSEEGKGTCIIGKLRYDHIDRLPIGDVASTMKTLILAKSDIHYVYEHHYRKQIFICDTEEIKGMLEGVPIQDLEILEWVENFIKNNVEALYECWKNNVNIDK